MTTAAQFEWTEERNPEAGEFTSSRKPWDAITEFTFNDLDHNGVPFDLAQVLAGERLNLAAHKSAAEYTVVSVDDRTVTVAPIYGYGDPIPGTVTTIWTKAEGDFDYDDTALIARIAAEEKKRAEEDALLQSQIDGKADKDHDHPDLEVPEHNHDTDYAPKTHDHPYAAPDHTHPPQDLTHDHDDQYFAKGGANDGDGNPLPLPYGNAYDLGTALDEHDHPAADSIIVSDQEPQPEPGEEIAVGTLWYDTDRLEMFIYYDGGWITTTALGARVAEGEAKQREIESRLTQAMTDIAALRHDLEDRVTVALWRFVGYDVDPTTLASGEFCLHKEGLEGTSPLRIWMSVYDPGGNFWKTSIKLSANYPSSFQVSLDEPGQSGQYHGLIKQVKLNVNPADYGPYESGIAHIIDLNYVYTRRNMREGYFYNINCPGYLPVYMKFSRVKDPLTKSDAELEGIN